MVKTISGDVFNALLMRYIMDSIGGVDDDSLWSEFLSTIDKRGLTNVLRRQNNTVIRNLSKAIAKQINEEDKITIII